MVKNLPAMLETWIWSLGRKDPLEKEMATDSSILAWRRKWLLNPVFLPGEFHGQRSLMGYSSWGCKRVRHDWMTNSFIHFNWTKDEMGFISCIFSPFSHMPLKTGAQGGLGEEPRSWGVGGGWGAQLPLHTQLECGSCWLWVVGWWFMHFFIILGIREWAHCFFFLYLSSSGNNFIKIPLWSISIMPLKSV